MPQQDQHTATIFTGASVFEFLDDLRKKGFTVEPDDYYVAIQLSGATNWSDKDALQQFKYKVAATVCRNKQEQEEFYQLFDHYTRLKETEAASQTGQASLAARKRKAKYRKLITLAASVILIAFLFAFFRLKVLTTSYAPITITLSGQHIVAGKTASVATVDYPPGMHFSRQQTLYQRWVAPLYDSSGLQVSVQTGNTTAANSRDIIASFKDTGKQEVHIAAHNPGFRKDTVLTLFACDERPAIHAEGAVYQNREARFIVTNNTHKQPVAFSLDDTSVTVRNDTLRYTFKKAGTYTVSSKFQQQVCQHEETNQFPVTVNQEFQLQPNDTQWKDYIAHATLTTLFFVLLAVLSLLTLSGLLLYRYARKFLLRFVLNEQTLKTENDYLDQTVLPLFEGNKIPADVRFKNNNHLISDGGFMRRLSLHLKKKVESGIRKLNLQKTINTTIRRHDLYTPILDEKAATRDFLVFVDHNYNNPVQAALFGYLVATLTDNQVAIDEYLFNRDPQQLYTGKSNIPVSLRYIRNRHYQSVLVVFSDGYSFIDPVYSVLDESVRKEYAFWGHRILITPAPSNDWSVQEKILATFFHLIPADTIGLEMIQHLLQKNIYKQETIRTSQYNTYTAQFIESESIEALQTYAGELFPWIAALAVYPRINWQVIIAIGKALAPELVTYTNLLKISRIDWINAAMFATRLRLELLKTLSTDQEIKARQALIALLENGALIDTETIAENERTLQLIINKFILYAYAPDHFPAYQKEEKQFLKLFGEKAIGDIALKVYLQQDDPDKDNDEVLAEWKTPLDKENRTVTLSGYYNKQTGQTDRATVIDNKVRNFRRKLLYGLVPALLLLLGLSWVGLIQKPRIPGLVHISFLKPLKWVVRLDRDSCFTAFAPDSMFIRSKSGNIQRVSLSDRKDSFVFIRPNDAFASISLSNARGDILSDTFPVNNGNRSVARLSLHIEGPGCRRADTVFIQYHDLSQRVDATLLADHLRTLGYIVLSAIREDPQITGNEITYYTRDKNATASQLRATVNAFFSITTADTFVTRMDNGQAQGKQAGQYRIMIRNLPDSMQNVPVVFIQYTPFSRKNDVNNFRNFIIRGNIARNNGIDSVVYNGPSEVRYFDDKDAAAASKLAAAAGNYFSLSSVSIVKTSWGKSKRPGQKNIELWLNLGQDCTSFGSGDSYAIYYDFDKMTLRPEAVPILDKIISILKDNPSQSVEINSRYYSQDNNYQYNIQVARRRGQSIADYFVKNGISPSKITTKGISSQATVGSCYSRVEILLVSDLGSDTVVSGTFDTIIQNTYVGYQDGKRWLNTPLNDKYKIQLSLTRMPVADDPVAAFRCTYNEGKCQYAKDFELRVHSSYVMEICDEEVMITLNAIGQRPEEKGRLKNPKDLQCSFDILIRSLDQPKR